MAFILMVFIECLFCNTIYFMNYHKTYGKIGDLNCILKIRKSGFISSARQNWSNYYYSLPIS